MRLDGRGILLYALLAALPVSHADAQAGPGPNESISKGRIAPTYSVPARCPNVRQTDLDDPSAAIVQLYVGPTGVPSKTSLKTSSNSATLDAAALACVQQLRFLPATRLGDAVAVGSWQVIAWKAAPAPRFDSAAANAAAVGAAPTPAAAPGAIRAAEARAAVRVCVDDAGKLVQDPQITHSSGDTQFDQAALNVAKAASGSYRAAPGASAAPGCLEIALKSERK
jgi:TonB family protein